MHVCLAGLYSLVRSMLLLLVTFIVSCDCLHFEVYFVRDVYCYPRFVSFSFPFACKNVFYPFTLILCKSFVLWKPDSLFVPPSSLPGYLQFPFSIFGYHSSPHLVFHWFFIAAFQYFSCISSLVLENVSVSPTYSATIIWHTESYTFCLVPYVYLSFYPI